MSEAVPLTWAAWDLPREKIAMFFAASARFYRAAPWQTLAEHRIMRAVLPSGRTWWAHVLGKMGVQPGLSLNERASDLERVLGGGDLERAVRESSGVIVVLAFEKRSDVPPELRREIRRSGWEIAGSEAYPWLMVFNSIDNDATRQAVEDLVLLLDAVPGFVATHRRLLQSDTELTEPVRWTHESTGVTIELEDRALGASDGAFQIPETLAPCGPEGPGARPSDTVVDLSGNERRDLIDGLCDRFAAWLSQAADAPSLSEAQRHRDAAKQFLESLTWHSRSPWAVTEYDLRDHLYRGYPVMTTSVDEGRAFLRSLRIFFDFLEKAEGVRCAWAAPILSDEYAFIFRWDLEPGGLLGNADIDWNAALTVDLHERLLLPVPDPQSTVVGSDIPGPVEWRLYDELHRHVLRWRDEGIREGIVEPERLRAVLLERQREWMRTPNALVDGETPERAIPREQEAKALEQATAIIEQRKPAMTLFDAFRADAAAGAPLPDPDATLWLVLGHGLERIARARDFPPDVPVLLKNVAETFRPKSGEEWAGDPALADGFWEAAQGRGVDALVERCLTIIQELEAAGGRNLASVVRRALRDAFPEASAG